MSRGVSGKTKMESNFTWINPDTPGDTELKPSLPNFHIKEHEKAFRVQHEVKHLESIPFSESFTSVKKLFEENENEESLSI